MTKLLSRIISLVALMLCTGGLAQAAPLRVQVYGTHEGGNIIYHYKVINISDITLHNIVIGSIYNSQHDFENAQFERRPVGWDYGPQLESGVEIKLAPTSTTQPPFWKAEMYGSGRLFLEWRILPGEVVYSIPPGQSLAGFSVTVPLADNRLGPHEYYQAGQIVDPASPAIGRDDDIYLRCSFKTEYMDVKTTTIQAIRGQVEISDTTPPTLAVTLTPATLWPPNGKMVTVNAAINVKDDVDPNPVINLVSITANEPLDADDIQGAKPGDDVRQFQLKAKRDGNNLAGRIYTVTYVAKDASGNRALTRTTVTVPHDQGRK